MQQADQKKLIQESNLLLVNIRNAEIVYFNNFYLNFGTQAAVINAALCGSLSQCPALQLKTAYIWKFTYWIGAALTVALATHLMLCTIFITVYGQGMAIRGPRGSMVRTIDGMVEEQHHVTFAFVLLIFVFVVLQQVGMFFVVMDVAFAIISSVFMVLSLGITYHYGLRIYNRFYWDKNKTGWNDLTFLDPDEQLKEFDPHAEDLWQKRGPADSGGWGKRATGAKQQKGKKKTLFQKLGFRRRKRNPGLEGEEGDQGGGLADRRSSEGVAMKDIHNPLNNYSSPYYDNASILSDGPYLEVSKLEQGADVTHNTVAGYMTLKTRRSFPQDQWVRRYFVIRANLIYYYNSEMAFKENSAKPINKRPIDLEGYALIAGSSEPPYALTLVPLDPNDIRKAWRFRCDTLTEFQNWVDIFSAVLKATVAASSGDVRDSMLIQIPPAS